MTTKTWAKEISWVFGSCSSQNKVFANNKVYDTQCCQPAGNYQLQCKDTYGDGWNGGYIQIGSSATKLCSDFTSGRQKNVANVAHTASKVCVDLKLVTKVWAKEISFEFGGCSSTAAGTYANNKEYTIRCCQLPGPYTMKCKDTYGDGWNGAYVQVGSSTAKVCQDFTSGKEKSLTVNHPSS